MHIPLEAMKTAPMSLKIIGVLGDSPRNVNLMEATACGIVVKITEYGNTLRGGEPEQAPDGVSPERFVPAAQG